MALSDFIPFYQRPRPKQRWLEQRSSAATKEVPKGVAKLFRSATLALGFTGIPHPWRTTFEEAPYDFDRINKAADTDSYVKQGLSKYHELLWKEGWQITSENPDALQYLHERIDYMEFAMGQSFQSFLDDVGDQLVKFHNCFIAKSRGDLAPFFPHPLNPPEGKKPLVGYYIIPAETVEIQRNRNNNVVAYRQKIDSLTGGFENKSAPRWRAENVIHLSVDKKPGRAFGTPFLVSVLDDVIALRQMEEDIQNMVHKELFPLYKYKVGTPEAPADPDEITQAVRELESLRNDGGLVLPERHDVDVVGAESESLDASDYLEHFVIRVCVGLGLSPHHLGLVMSGGNRAVTDRLDVALYDRIKSYQRYLEHAIRIKIFSELLFEGGFNPVANPMKEGISDRCEFKFREIDVETQVKKENHILNKWAQNAITWEETRLELGYPPDADENDLFQALMTRLSPDPAAATNGGGSNNAPKKPDAQTPSTGGRSNQPNKRKGVGNRSRPSNQHGRRSAPKIRHDADLMNKIVESLGEDDTIEFASNE